MALFEELLRWSDESLSHSIGFESPSGAAIFFSVLQATYQLPYNSGILIFTNRSALDEDLAALALGEVAKKRIRVSVDFPVFVCLTGGFVVVCSVGWWFFHARNRA